MMVRITIVFNKKTIPKNQYFQPPQLFDLRKFSFFFLFNLRDLMKFRQN